MKLEMEEVDDSTICDSVVSAYLLLTFLSNVNRVFSGITFGRLQTTGAHAWN